ncbi:MAG: class I SAM-dependent methyltransferase [Fibrobacter sp.]|nr:class I SAM-dependent methyltransferase [Fibrobacter sp.]
MYKNKVRRDIAMLVPQDAKSVLEIGAGAGVNCVLYPKNAYKVAIEPENRTDAQTADKVPGGFNEYHHVFYEQYTDDKKFDLIVMCDVLEHVNDPVDLISFCKKHLNPNGHILISLPNFLSLETILQIIILRDFRYVKVDQGERCIGVLDVNHKTFWTKKSFLRFAKENGLLVNQIIGIRKQLKFMPRLLRFSNFLPLQYGFLISVAQNE